MKNFYRLLPVLALLICIWGLVGCLTAPGPDLMQTTEAPAVPATPGGDLVLVSGGKAEVQMIRAEGASKEVTTEISRLYKKISEVTGGEPEFATDFLRITQTRTEAEETVPAILAGPTNYTASETILAG